MVKIKITTCNDVSCKDDWVEESEIEEFIKKLDKEIEVIMEE